MAEVAEARTRTMGPAGNATCSVALTHEPWTLPIDVLAISVGPDGYGSLGRAFLDATGSDLALSAASAPEIVPERPHVVAVPPDAGTSLLAALFTTVHDLDEAATIGAAGRAAASCVRAVDQLGYASLALPLLGAGMAGLPVDAVADVIVASVRAELADLGRASSLRQVVFVVERPDDAILVEEAWRGYRSQPFTNDRPEGPDLLRIRDEVEALADMLLLRDVEPPLAVGILGGWGSGKSFVMHLIRERIHAVRAETLTEDECWGVEGASPFVGHVYPVEFNAWTYARADLWAALMQTTLTELDRQLGVERRLVDAGAKLLDGKAWSDLYALPANLHALYSKTPNVQTGGRDLFEALDAVHQDDRDKLREKEAELAGLLAKRAEAERQVEEHVDTTLAAQVDSARWLPFRMMLGHLVGASAADVDEWVADAAPDAKAVVNDARALAAALRGVRPPDSRIADTVVRKHRIAAAVFVVACVVMPPVLYALRHVLHAVTLSAGAVTAMAAVGSFLRLARGWTAVARRFAVRLSEWQRSVEDEVRRVEATRDRQVEVRKEADPALAAVRQQIVRAEHELAHLRERVGLVAEYRSVAEFVTARLGDRTYEERLGVMQQISEDLASISRSLTVGADDIDADAKRLLFPRGPARVVLFIDDLDRCAPDKVVEVLEAVQLLLATNLFVVVVAIDVRYVTKALEKQYAGVLEADGEPSGVDYLEKIIQVPYRTRPLTRDAAQRFLAGQLRVAPVPRVPVTGRDDASLTLGGRVGQAAPDHPEAPTARSVARDLLFTQEELDVLAGCCAVFSLSPRAAKRVANVAKLFRMVWARRGHAVPSLDETATVALLVGLAAAHPEIQRDALAYLSTRSWSVRTTVADLLHELAKPDGERRRALYARWLAALDAATDGHPFPGDHERASFRIGNVPFSEVAPVVEFASAFCFVADVTAG